MAIRHIDRGAKSDLRQRRAIQQLSQGAGTSSIQVTAPLDNNGSIYLDLAAAGGLVTSSQRLSIKLDPTDPGLALSADGLAVLLDDAGGLAVSADGIGIDAGGVTTAMLADGAVTSDKLDPDIHLDVDPAGGLQWPTDGLGIKPADNTIQTDTDGASVKLAPNGGIGSSDDGLLIVGGTPITTETPQGTIDGTNADFTLSDAPTSGVALLFVDGLLMQDDAAGDYTRDGANITFNAGAIPVSGDVLLAAYLTGPKAWGEAPNGTINGVNAEFTLANKPKPASMLLFLNGVLMSRGTGSDYTVDVDVPSITFETGSEPQSGDKIFAAYEKDVS